VASSLLGAVGGAQTARMPIIDLNDVPGKPVLFGLLEVYKYSELNIVLDYYQIQFPPNASPSARLIGHYNSRLARFDGRWMLPWKTYRTSHWRVHSKL
jgi:hypothetical protein